MKAVHANQEVNYLFLNRGSRWEGFHSSGLSLDPDGTLRLAPLPRLDGQMPLALAALTALAEPAGVAVAPDGTLYFTDPDLDLCYRRDACEPDAPPAPLLCTGSGGDRPTQLRRPRGLLWHP